LDNDPWVLLLETNNQHHHHHHHFPSVPVLLEKRYPNIFHILSTKIWPLETSPLPECFCVPSLKLQLLNNAILTLDEKVMCQEAWSRHWEKLQMDHYESEKEKIVHIVETACPEIFEYFCKTRHDKELDMIAKGIQNEMVQLLQKLNPESSWISSLQHRQEALEKIAHVKILIGKRPRLDQEMKDHFLKELENISPTSSTLIEESFDPVEAYIKLKRIKTRVKFFRPRCSDHDRGWTLSTFSRSAGYDVTRNEVFAPLGMLMFLELDRKDDMEKLASFGTIIGHELFHAIDAIGTRYDVQGCWTGKENPQFYSKLVQPAVHFYSLFHASQIYDSRLPELFVDGVKTCDENLADIAGLQCVYSLIQNVPEVKVKRAFFQSYALAWARVTKYDRAHIEKSFSKSHAPEIFRVMGSLATLDDFFKLFQVDPRLVSPFSLSIFI